MRAAKPVCSALIAAMLSVLAGQAIAAGVLIKRPLWVKPKPRIAVQAVAPRPRIAARPPAPAARLTPKYAFHPRTVIAAASSVPLNPPTLPPAPVDPSKPQLLALNGDWSMFRFVKDGRRTCFAATKPKDSVPRQQAREQAYFYVTDATPGSVKHELTFKLGLSATSAMATVDGRDFQLAASNGLAYPPDEHTQKDLLQALRHGHTLILKSDQPGSTAVVDSYSLLGIEQSLRATDQACASVSARN